MSKATARARMTYRTNVYRDNTEVDAVGARLPPVWELEVQDLPCFPLMYNHRASGDERLTPEQFDTRGEFGIMVPIDDFIIVETDRLIDIMHRNNTVYLAGIIEIHLILPHTDHVELKCSRLT